MRLIDTGVENGYGPSRSGKPRRPDVIGVNEWNALRQGGRDHFVLKDLDNCRIVDRLSQARLVHGHCHVWHVLESLDAADTVTRQGGKELILALSNGVPLARDISRSREVTLGPT